MLAAAVRLIDLGLFRIGGEQYARANGTFGLVTAQRGHVQLGARSVVLCFQAKGGQEFGQEIRDPAVCQVVRSLVARRDPSPQLLAFWSPSARAWRELRSEHVNTYLKQLTDEDVTAKDFRTWHASVLMAMLLGEQPLPSSTTRRRGAVAAAHRGVAELLQNTPAVTRVSYVDPRVVDLWEAGRRLPARDGGDEIVPTPASRTLSRLLRGG